MASPTSSEPHRCGCVCAAAGPAGLLHVLVTAIVSSAAKNRFILIIGYGCGAWSTVPPPRRCASSLMAACEGETIASPSGSSVVDSVAESMLTQSMSENPNPTRPPLKDASVPDQTSVPLI